jgi:hypothetical protein
MESSRASALSRVVKVVIGTTNPAKRAAVATVLDKLFPSGGSQLLAVSVPSGVSAQPFDVHETVPPIFFFSNSLRRATK